MNVKIGRGSMNTTDSMHNRNDALCHICHKRVLIINRRPDGKDACQDCYPATKGIVEVAREEADAR